MRWIINTLSPLPPAQQEQERKRGYEFLEQAMNYRPDLSIPLTVLYGKDKSPADKFMGILEYVLDYKNGWCEESYPDPYSSDPMTRHFQGTAVNSDWCLHQNHKAIINYPIGCPDRASDKAPF